MANDIINIDNIPNMGYYYHPNPLSGRHMSTGWQLSFQEVKTVLYELYRWKWFKLTKVLIPAPLTEDIDVKKYNPTATRIPTMHEVVPTPSSGTQQSIIAHLRAAQSALDGALVTAREGNALAMEVPVFQQLEKMKKDLTAAMQQVGKMRGLG